MTQSNYWSQADRSVSHYTTVSKLDQTDPQIFFLMGLAAVCVCVCVCVHSKWLHAWGSALWEPPSRSEEFRFGEKNCFDRAGVEPLQQLVKNCWIQRSSPDTTSLSPRNSLIPLLWRGSFTLPLINIRSSTYLSTKILTWIQSTVVPESSHSQITTSVTSFFTNKEINNLAVLC